MSDLKPYQERVVMEHSELRDKIAKLRFFIESPDFEQVEDSESVRLLKQLDVMDAYLSILRERIAFFNK